jgi:hypothetical protein
MPYNRQFYSGEQYRHGTNLCQFFRTLLLSSLITAITLAVYSYAFYTIIILPFILFPSHSIAHNLLIFVEILLTVTCVLGLLAVVGIGLDRYISHRHSLPKQPTKPPGFAALAWAYAVAVKHQFCPTITFDEKPYDQ